MHTDRNRRRHVLGMERLEARSLLTTTLAISEINYEPYEPVAAFGDAPVASSEFEFIELVNTGTQPVNLQGLRLARVPIGGALSGVDFFLPAAMLPPNGHLVVVRNLAAFRSRYGDAVPVAGEWSGGGLSNQGETLTVLNAAGDTIIQVTYGSDGDWPTRADGLGASLVIRDATQNPNDPDNWRSSPEYGGSPGRASAERTPRIVINEVLAHTDPPKIDTVELHNLTDATVNVSRWYFSDRIGNPFNYSIPAGTTIPAGGYLLIDEDDFNPGGGRLPTDFALSERGDQLLLISADANRRPLYIEDYAVLGATPNGLSAGNVSNVRDGIELLPLASLTFGSANGGHLPSPFVISELQYHPADNDVYKEFIEITNATSSALPLDGWRITEGVDAEIPPGTLLGPGATVVLVAFDPQNSPRAAAFREYYDIGTSVRLIGPWSADQSNTPDTLSNSGETLTLRYPLDDVDLIVYPLADQVDYNDRLPWPVVADGGGGSISRTASGALGNLSTSWQATRPSPGNQPPHLSTSPEVYLGQSVPAELGRDGSMVRGAGDIDVYRFRPTSTGTFLVRAEGDGPAGADTFLRLFATSGAELAFNDNHGDSTDSQLEALLEADTEYLIIVSGSSSSPRDYDPFTGTGLTAGNSGPYLLSVQETEVHAFPWFNPALPEDVDANGSVVPFDALLVINELNNLGSVSLPVPPDPAHLPPPYIDVSGDNLLTPFDALLVINFLNEQSSVQAAFGKAAADLTAFGADDVLFPSQGQATQDRLLAESDWRIKDRRLIAAAVDQVIKSAVDEMAFTRRPARPRGR